MPQRAVGFDEINAVIIPSGTNENLRNLLNESGVNVVEYEADNEEDILEKQNSLEDVKFSTKRGEESTDIFESDVKTLQSIGKKNVKDFSAQDIEKAKKWARIYKNLGTKSPFFRAWFGDYRAYDTNQISVSDIPLYVKGTEERLKNRGIWNNSDTGWQITVSGEGERNTISHAGALKLSEYGLSGIKSLIENAVLLDTEVHEHHSNNTKNDMIAFDHKMYAIGKGSNVTALYKITVEEYFQDKSHPDKKRFHNLKYIEKVADVSADALSDIDRSGGSAMSSSTTTYTVADLFAVVNAKDKQFNPGKEVNTKLLNADGTPRIFYHGTANDFDVFNMNEGVYGKGAYFTT